MAADHNAYDHLRNILYILADLHPDDRCQALDDALAFYNAARPREKVAPSGGGYLRLTGPSFDGFDAAISSGERGKA